MRIPIQTQLEQQLMLLNDCISESVSNPGVRKKILREVEDLMEIHYRQFQHIDVRQNIQLQSEVEDLEYEVSSLEDNIHDIEKEKDELTEKIERLEEITTEEV